MATDTAVDVVMPQMGVSVSEGTITKWLKQEGESVAADEALLEISTDKVDTEVPSPGEGILQQILVPEGETVDVGTKLAVIAPEGAAAPAAEEKQEAEAPPEPATQQAADEAMAAASEGVGEVAPSADSAPAAPPTPAPPAPTENGKTFVSPVVARIASEHGVDPNQVQGTGRGGRVTKKDILGYIEAGPAEPAPALARAIADVAERARSKKLTPDDVQGGSFTITNPGGWGAIMGTPIISQPQVAILDVEALVKRPVVVTDENGQDQIAIRQMMNLCLSYDHRLVDGAYAAQFMKELRENLEAWDERAE